MDMIRTLLIAVMAAAVLGACTQYSNNNADYRGGSDYRHAGGNGPSFSSRILP
jgi:hypothetical protein